jgi:4-hydroxythreonine-4-phosphate dehydrogenase
MTVDGKAERRLAVSMGDPAGIGPEIILKAAARRARADDARIVVIGDLAVMQAAARRLGNVPEPFAWSAEASLPRGRDRLPVLPISALPAAARQPGKPTVAGADASYRYVVAGAKMALAGDVCGLVTAPISKEWVNRAGHRIPGHTELLARICGVRRWRMMFSGQELRVALVTVHIGLAKVPRALTVEKVLDTIRLLAEHLRDRLKMAKPRVAVLGLNPHAGENGLFGSEESRIIEPAIVLARRARIDAYGPLPPDTAFARPSGKFEFDGFVAMYHDQGLIPLKALDFDHAVNVTLGLPFIRTSPDHGTAFDISGGNCANPASMIAAIDFARRALSPDPARSV